MILLFYKSILYKVFSIFNDGEINYIFFMISLYLGIYNIFLILMSVCGFISKDSD